MNQQWNKYFFLPITMMIKKIHAQHLTLAPSRHFLMRASVLLMVAASLALMVMSRAENSAISRLRLAVSDVFTPVISVASTPLDFIANAGNWINEMVNLRAENIALKNANLELLKWQTLAKDVQAENAGLRSLMNVVPDRKSSYITAQIVSDVGGPYVHSALIGGGNKQGIKKNQPVINERGLVGRIIEVGENSSRALLLSDINSRVPVITESSHEKTILVGNNSNLPSLSYLAADSAIKIGERVITSGDGGIFPHGIAVGIVDSVGKGVVRVRPFVDSASSEYVSIVDYQF
jgi:rod shape-determining protein MreC